MMEPASPPVRISRVLATFRPSRKRVAKSRMVGKTESSAALLVFMVTRRTSSESIRLVASRMSRSLGEMGVTRVTTSPRTQMPRPQSA